MSLVRVKTDTQPLCDKHYGPMKLVDIVSRIGSDVGVRTALACTQERCKRQYDTDYGYYTVSVGQIERETITRVRCPQCERAMYLKALEAQGSIQKWACPQFSCNGCKKSRGPL